MNTPISPKAFVIAVVIFTATLLSATIITPHDKYYRYQEHHSGTTRKADWIYERLNFDPTPIDVALIGTSRMGAGLSAPDIEALYCDATGRIINVANLSIPQTGRNMHYVIAKELFRTKSPDLVVIEVNERETRRPHDDFVYLADAHDVLSAPMLINLNFFSDILRLPGRQASLFLSSALNRPELRNSFNKNDYAGNHLDRTRSLDLIDGRVVSREISLPREKLDAMRDMRIATAHADKHLPQPLQSLEYRLSRFYIKKIKTNAELSDAELSFAFLPAYRRSVIEEDVLSQFGVSAPILTLGVDLADNHTYWQDAIHLNTSGAILASERFAKALATTHPALGEPGNCHRKAPH